MSTPASPSAFVRSPASALAGVLFAAAAVVGGWRLWREPAAPPARPQPGEVVLEATVSLARGPSDHRLLAPGPSLFDIEVTTVDSVAVTFGPPSPSTPAGEGGPAPETSTRISGMVNGTFVGRVLVYAAGMQVLRVSQPDPKEGGTATIRVRRRPGP